MVITICVHVMKIAPYPSLLGLGLTFVYIVLLYL